MRELLMENAGDAVYFVILNQFGIKNKRFVVFCGMGNNGGDGFVIARKLHSNGARVKVFILGDREKFKGAAKLNLDILKRLPVEIREVEDEPSVRMDITHADAVVDAILGTGLMREVKGRYRDIIDRINRSGKIVFSADIPITRSLSGFPNWEISCFRGMIYVVNCMSPISLFPPNYTIQTILRWTSPRTSVFPQGMPVRTKGVWGRFFSSPALPVIWAPLILRPTLF